MSADRAKFYSQVVGPVESRSVSRAPVLLERLSLTAQGQVRYRLKTPYRDGTKAIVLEPLDFIARLAALVPPRACT